MARLKGNHIVGDFIFIDMAQIAYASYDMMGKDAPLSISFKNNPHPLMFSSPIAAEKVWKQMQEYWRGDEESQLTDKAI